MLADERGGVTDDEVGAGGTSVDRGVERRDVVAYRFPHRAIDRGCPLSHREQNALDERQPIGLGIRQRPEQNPVGQAEHGRACPDDQRQGDERGDREDRCLEQDADAVAHIAAEHIDHGQAVHVLNLLNWCARVAEGQARFPPRLVRRATARDQFVRVEVDVGTDLLRPFPLAFSPTDPSEERHGTSG